MLIHRRVTTRAPLERVFTYLADFTSTNEWDPGTVTTTRVSGDGGLGTEYANVSRFLGRKTELRYVVEDYVPNFRVALRGENATVVAHDTISVSSGPEGGTQVDYRAHFSFKGLAAVAAPFLRPAFRRLGDEAAVGLDRALDRLSTSAG